MENGRVVVIDSEGTRAASLERYFAQAGFEVLTHTNGQDLIDLVRRERPTAVVLDIDASHLDGWEVCKRLKGDLDLRKTVVILTSSKGDVNDKIRGFEIGADDYLVKPYDVRELVARTRAIVRRIEEVNSKRIRVKDIEIDLDEHKVRKAGKPIDLTYIQFKLLYLLASRRDSVFSRKEILEKVWGKKVYVTSRTVDVHIKRLREKLGELKYPSQYIETIHGTGYRFL